MKIALIGSAPSSIRLAPYGNPDWKIWACSPGAYGVAQRIDAFFELHRYEPGQPWFSQDYCRFLEKFPGPVYMAEKRNEIPNSIAVPIDDLVAKYGPYFFTSSLSYMFALAMEAIEAERDQEAKEGKPQSHSAIGLWGVDMAATEEYGYQRAGCQYFAMLARAKGIEVGVPPESDLLRPPPLYGVSEIDHARIKIMARRRELQMRVANAQAEIDNKSRELMFLQGALDDLNWNENTWTGDAHGINRRYVEPPLVPALVDRESMKEMAEPYPGQIRWVSEEELREGIKSA